MEERAKLTDRQQQILDIARQNGRVIVDELAARFDVTPQTIRKDLNDLCDQRLLSRIHGGALFPSGIENMEYEARRKIALHRFIYALGIRHIGETNAKLLARSYGTFEAFRAAMREGEK